MKPGSQGFVYFMKLAGKSSAQSQFVMKCLFVDSKKKEEVEEVMKTWKELSVSERNFVPYVEHFYEESNLSLSFIILFELCLFV
jgi:hypothetical protein